MRPFKKEPIPPFVHDVLSSLYFIRTQPLEVGKDFSLDANSGATTWPLSVHVLSRRNDPGPRGSVLCFRLEPILAGDGIFQASGELEVWVTEAPPHIPVLLRSKVLVGAFDAEMTEFRADDEKNFRRRVVLYNPRVRSDRLFS
jgi:hypothetical protein